MIDVWLYFFIIFYLIFFVKFLLYFLSYLLCVYWLLFQHHFYSFQLLFYLNNNNSQDFILFFAIIFLIIIIIIINCVCLYISFSSNNFAKNTNVISSICIGCPKILVVVLFQRNTIEWCLFFFTLLGFNHCITLFILHCCCCFVI